MAKATLTMDDLLANADTTAKQFTQGEVIVGKILVIRKHEVLVDLGAQGIGLVPRREVGFSRALEIGDEVTASIVEPELDNGYALFHFVKLLRIVVGTKLWPRWRVARLSKFLLMTLTVVVYWLNMTEFGILTVSQLSAEHYPRVGSSDKDEILQRLNVLIGKTLECSNS